MAKTMFVTGATKNTGFAIARRFASDGWNVAVSSRDQASSSAAAGRLKEDFPQVETLGVRMDPANVDDIHAAFAQIAEKFGGLDAFVSNAANLGVGLSILNTTPEEYDSVMNANARGTFFGAQEAVKLMKGGGAMVFVSSVHQLRSVPGRICYTVSKAAIGGMVRSMAVELGYLGIRVNSVLAGAIRTERWNALSEEQIATWRSRYPVGRESYMDEIAAAVRFLCSDEAATISGVEMPVDSGLGASLLQYRADWAKNDTYNVKYWEKGKTEK